MSFTYSHGHQVPWDQYQTDIVKKNKEIAQLKEDARTNLDYSVKYEKDLVKKNEEIAELKAKMNLSPCLYAVQYEKDLVKKDEEIALLKEQIKKGKNGWWEFDAEVRMRKTLQEYNKKLGDMLGHADNVWGVCNLDEVKKQMDELKAENEKLNSQKKEEKVKDVKVGEGDVGWEKY